ncbi:MAG: HEPN domain-containing protein [Candidatus Margulisiibacteriota bacterium]|jgi:HEPN domain-containing protein
MKNKELANKYLSKAYQDIKACKVLMNDKDIATEIIGFHCQQAAEKIIKAILAFLLINFIKTHDLTTLLHLLEKEKIKLPEKFCCLDDLTPFAVEYRYDFYLGFQDEFETTEYIVILEDFYNWADKLINN